jgi:hypothetical protein
MLQEWRIGKTEQPNRVRMKEINPKKMYRYFCVNGGVYPVRVIAK